MGTRFGLIGVVAVALAAGGVFAWFAWPREATLDLVRAPDQNVLLITIDTLRADALGSAGGRAATPHLDRLASDGVRYDFAHAHTVMTLPSHASILTGLYPFQHGVRDNSGYRVRPGTQTLATRLKALGFVTGAFIGAFPLDSQFGLNQGFGVYDDRLNEVSGPADFVFSERRAPEVVDAAMKWVGAQQRKWFLWVHVYDPHAPYAPPEPFASQYRDAPYAGEVACTDKALAPLLQQARASAGRPTLVIVTGDHGEGLGDHGEATHGLFAYEATLRVPLIVAQYRDGAPAGAPAGASAPRAARISTASVQHVDLLPTVLDALGSTQPDGLPGRSLAGLRAAEADLRASYFEALTTSLGRGWAPLYGVLVGREKFIELPLPELYDLRRDAAEQTNLIDTKPDRRRLLEARLKDVGPTSPGQQQAENTETAARLRALGYTSGRARPSKVYTERDDPKRLVELDRAIHKGIEAFHAGRLDQAIGIYTALVAERPDMTTAALNLAFLQWETGAAKAAMATLRAVRAEAGPDPEVDARLGMYLGETGSVREALALLEPAAALPEPDLDVLNALGITWARSGQAGKALDVFQRVLALDPRNAMAQQNIGAVHLSAGNLQAARAAFEEAIRLNPSWAASYTGLGAAELRAGNRAAAIDAWRRAIELNPSDFDALFNLGTELINDGQPGAARPFVERFVRAAPRAFYARDIDRLQTWLVRR